ncbi:hypothetical protein A7C99_6288 [Trichophyton rubrum]|uniref:Uncharacterized protein n=1 Tax=Trichophyton rubrum TaxID=5551 RepID=A0A178ENP9_TRIRU|nr:Myb-like domain [Trichophyton rubrum]OAL61720.1 hypothetical protein A7C99_6288 [Trichophyton rubrum]
METVRRINRWTQEEDSILIQKLYEQQTYDLPSAATDWQKIAAALPGRSNKDCRKRWFNVLSGGLRKGAWSPEEDSYLRDAVRIEGKSWMRVAQHVPQRTADQCAKRWQHFLDPTLDRSEWTAEENERLLCAVQQHGRRWLDIRNQYFPLRSPNALKNQYSILMRRHERNLAAVGKRTQNVMDITSSYHSTSMSTLRTPSSHTGSKKSRKTHCEAETYIKPEPDDYFMDSFYGELEFKPTMSPATDYGFVGKGVTTPDPIARPYAGFLKQEEVSLTEYDAPCYTSSLGPQYEANAIQIPHMDAGISSNTTEDMWMAYPTSPSSTAPSDGDLGGFSHRDQWGYSVTGMPLQGQNALATYGYSGYH